MKELSRQIMSAVVDRNKFREEGLDYVRGNAELANDVFEVIDYILDDLQRNYFGFSLDELKKKLVARNG